MASVRIILWLDAGLTDVIKHLVLALAGNMTVRNDALYEALVERVCVDLILEEEM